MDFLGRSILELSSSGPGDLAAIAILQQEVAAIQSEIGVLRNEVTFLQNESKTLEDDIKRIDDQVAFVQRSLTDVEADVKTQERQIGQTRVRWTARFEPCRQQ